MDVENNEKLEKNIPYIALEDAEMRADRRNKRLFIALLVAIFLIFASNAIWLWAWCQYDYTSTTTETIEATQDGKGINLLAGGDFIYGSEGQDH